MIRRQQYQWCSGTIAVLLALIIVFGTIMNSHHKKVEAEKVESARIGKLQKAEEERKVKQQKLQEQKIEEEKKLKEEEAQKKKAEEEKKKQEEERKKADEEEAKRKQEEKKKAEEEEAKRKQEEKKKAEEEEAKRKQEEEERRLKEEEAKRKQEEERIRQEIENTKQEVHADINWNNIFSFVPNGIRSCKELFNNNKQLPKEVNANYQQFVQETAKHEIKEIHSAQFVEDYLVYITLVRAPFIRTVCETGFNAGYSSFAWLQANKDTHVYAFDIGAHSYTKPMADYLIGLFPKRLNVTWGDTKETLPKFHKEHSTIKCDLMIIDGSHKYETVLSDFNTFADMANPDNIVILNGYPDKSTELMTELGNVWETGKREGKLFEIFNCNYDEKDRYGFSVGKFDVI